MHLHLKTREMVHLWFYVALDIS